VTTVTVTWLYSIKVMRATIAPDRRLGDNHDRV